MTTTFTVDKSFAYIDRLTKHGTTFAACAGIYNRVIIAARASGGGVNLTGVSSQLTAQPLDIVSDGTPSAYYVLTPKGVTTLSTAANPAITAESVFDTGSNRWLFYSGGNLIVPTAGGGVRLQTAGGTVLAELSGLLSESTAAAFSGSVLYIFGAKRGKMAVVTVTATALVYEGTFDAPNCREVLRAVIDGTNLYCLNLHRIVRFSIAAPTTPVLAQDYGKMPVEFTDIAVVATGKLWIGLATSTPGLTGPYFFGPLYGVYDATNLEIHTAAPRMSAWMVNNVIPYYTSATIPTIVPTPAPAAMPPVVVTPPSLAPPAPVITSPLTSTGVEGSTWNYTITATGAGPITYGVASPPPWLTGINALTGALTGTLPTPGAIDLYITATNAGGTTTAHLVLTVTAIPVTLDFTITLAMLQALGSAATFPVYQISIGYIPANKTITTCYLKTDAMLATTSNPPQDAIYSVGTNAATEGAAPPWQNIAGYDLQSNRLSGVTNFPSPPTNVGPYSLTVPTLVKVQIGLNGSIFANFADLTAGQIRIILTYG